MYTLGIKPSLDVPPGLWGGHDSGACLLYDDEIVAIAEEERFTREKRDGSFPINAIKYVLEEGDISIEDVNILAVGRDPDKHLKYVFNNWKEYLPTSTRSVLSITRELWRIKELYSKNYKKKILNKINQVQDGEFSGQVQFVSHHRCHAASAAYCSPIDRPIVITIDGHGEHDSTVLWDCDLNREKVFTRTNSIGSFYDEGIRFLGMRKNRDAGKVMGLASYGSYRKEFKEYFDELVSTGSGKYDVTKITERENSVEFLEEYFGDRRVHPNDFTQRHKDFAYHLQLKTEEIATDLVKDHLNKSGGSQLALAGGVAMNCKMNYEISKLDCVDQLFIQPAANDSGICLGSALEAYNRTTGKRPQIDSYHVYHGSKYSRSDIRSELKRLGLNYNEIEDIHEKVAGLLAEGQLVGWFQGRMEYGARALGNRSILANPKLSNSLDNVNKKVKSREPWRPFAPSLIYEDREKYLEKGAESPYMILLDHIKESRREEVPAVTHVDGTTRPQTVREQDNRRYYKLIQEFKRKTGTPMVLNTSFNVSGEPIVESPRQAIRDFYSTGLDALAIGDFLLTKE